MTYTLKQALIGTLCGLLPIAAAVAATAPVCRDPCVFTNEAARIEGLAGTGAVPVHVSTITVNGFGPGKTLTLEIADGATEIAPICEGIHIVAFGAPVDREVRFIAMTPPSALDADAVRRTLPRSGDKLLAGEPFTILAMGDSVTHTGDYETMLARLLARATGNTHITVVDKSYSGCSIDATVRNFARDTEDIEPDLGLLMYGLNDQICFVPRRAYIEQYAWVADHIARRGGDTIFLQPTPHINVLRSGRDGGLERPEFLFRTIGYANAVTQLGQTLDVPVAQTFAAIWGEGGNALLESALAMWPLYPKGYKAPFTSLLEHAGRGDTIHPNALGHLQLAKAVCAAIGDMPAAATLTLRGSSRWEAHGVVSRITVSNATQEARSGRLAAFPSTRAELEVPDAIAYDLAPGESTSFALSWPTAQQPEDLLAFPNDVYLSQEDIPVSVVDFHRKGSSVHSVSCPFEVDGDFIPERIVVTGHVVNVRLDTPIGEKRIPVRLPEGKDVGRIPLVHELRGASQSGFAVAELIYTAVAIARPGEAVIDGLLDEWQAHPWVPVGEPCQARGWRGPTDQRERPEDAYLEFAFRAGSNSMHIAISGRGILTNDTVALFFDPRSPSELGTVGPYYWVDAAFKPKGAVRLRGGDTSPKTVGTTGRWKSAATGLTAELSVPYALLEQPGWPVSGDLGVSIVWRHTGPDGAKTRLTWSEDGHEWNPRWYGVVRKRDSALAPPVYIVRVK